MFKKTIALLTSTGLAIALGVANAAPQELSTEQMDNVNAGWYWNYTHNYANANAASTAFGPTTYTSTFTGTFTAPGVSNSTSSSSASSHSRYMSCGYCY